MAPNGISRKSNNTNAPTPSASHTDATMAAPNPTTATGKAKSLNFFATSTSKPSKSIKLKDEVTKKLPRASKPGTWDSDLANGDTHHPQPSINRIPPTLASSFPTGRPLADTLDVVKCNHCKRPILRHKAKQHIEDCLFKKQEKQRKKKEAKDARDAAARADRARDNSETPEAEEVLGGEGGGPGGAGRKTTSGKSEAGKKRKAEDDGGRDGKKKKKKDEGKTKLPRPKAPVDVEKQCGVELPNGGQCARSLTCKSHSMGAKRAVPGRSAPYDKLLADYQRKNQAKLQKAALDAMEPDQDDEMAQNGPIDSDEEKELVMAALARSRPQPLYQAYHVPLKQKYQMVRMKEMLGNALGGRNGGGLFRTAPREDLNGMTTGFAAGSMMSGTDVGTERRISGMTTSRMPSSNVTSRKQSAA